MLTIFSILQKYIAGVMSISMALTTSLTGTVGDYAGLQKKAWETNPSKTETTINLSVDLAAIEEQFDADFNLEEIPEIPGLLSDGKLNFSAELYTFSDVENMKFALSFTENLDDGYAIYLDSQGVAVAPGIVETVIDVLPAVDKEFEDVNSVYDEYFADNGMYFTWESIFGTDEIFDEESAEVENIVGMVISDVVEIMTKEENIKLYTELMKPVLEPVGKYYSEKTVDGVKVYTCKMNGIEMLTYLSEMYDVMYSEEMANNLFDYIIALVDDVDYRKYLQLLANETGLELPAEMTNEVIAAMIKTEIETFRAEFIETMVQFSDFGMTDMLKVIITGKDETGEYAELLEILPDILPVIKNSYAESTISEKDDAVTESSKIVISNGEKELASLSVDVKTEKYTGEIANSADVVPFDKTVDFEEIDNKLGYKDAVEKGVQSVEISWNSYMYPDENELHINYPYFYVTYNTKMLDSIISNPAFEAMDEEYKQAIIQVYENEYEFKYCGTTAHLIDNSVYLPLRRIMENAGYEVSWDGEARKAYVTVDGEKIEMTGVIVNDRTFVKIRDFEKLGATVDYSEDFYYEEAYNDFDKECYVTITFAK